RLFIATNQEHNRAAYLMKELGFEKVFEDIFHSARIGIAKPDPAYYAHVSNLLPASTMPPIFFDDTPAVVEGARAHGWDAYAFNGIENLNDSDFVRGILSAV
ncbi:MAG: HAD-IA family hydrolase, partial [Alphaproteobacteria bacterium]|nr:HAD-IA family hydrolase [Alphaproteobacteria bacterium]